MLKRLIRAGLVTGIVDGLFSSVLVACFYGSTVMRLWQGVASTVLGKTALDGGLKTAGIGLLMHFGVAFFWSAVFLLLVRSSASLRRVLASWPGVIAVAAIYGPLIWLVMSMLVIPMLTGRAFTVTPRWWIQLAGHFPFVGLPIVACIRGKSLD